MCITGQVAPAPGCQNSTPHLVESPNERRVRYPDTLIANTHVKTNKHTHTHTCLLYTSPSPRDVEESRMPSSA